MQKPEKPDLLRKSGRKLDELTSPKLPNFQSFTLHIGLKIFTFLIGCGEMWLAALAILIAGGLRHG